MSAWGNGRDTVKLRRALRLQKPGSWRHADHLFRTRAAVALQLAFLVLTATCQVDPVEAAKEMPQCGLTCALATLDQTACQPDAQSGLMNATCLCHDTDYHISLYTCMESTCAITEQLETSRIAAEICGLPKRSRKMDLLAGGLSLELSAFICVMLRLYSRWLTIYRFELDDYVMLAVVPLFLVFEGLGIAASKVFGHDVWTVHPDELTESLRHFYVDETIYLTILTLTKVSMLCFYLRVFPDRRFRILTYIVMAWVVFSGVIFVLLGIFQCWPIEAAWLSWKGDFVNYQCLNVNMLSFTAAGFSITQEVVILALPLPLLAKLNACWRQKAGLLVMFSLGLFTAIASTVRLRSLLVFGASKNPTWDYVDAIIWTASEVSVSMVVTSLPALRVLLNRWKPGILGSAPPEPGGSGHKRYMDIASKRCTDRSSHLGYTECDIGVKKSVADLAPKVKEGDKARGNNLYHVGHRRNDLPSMIFPPLWPGIRVWEATTATGGRRPSP